VELELISFKLCPFVQRAVITLEYQHVPYTITYIDLEDPPEWFADVSPFEKVPVLRVDGEANIFESAVICEYIDEITPTRLQPDDPLERARNRAWTEVASALLVDQYHLLGAAEATAYKRARQPLIHKLELMEEQVAGPFFNGAEPALIDFAIAPLFMRLARLGHRQSVYEARELPKIAHWSDALLEIDAVQRSVVPDFDELFGAMVRRRSSYVADLHGV
jgi:glutathione S-transferase